MHLAQALAFNTSLQYLKLWGCAVKDAGVTMLACMLDTNTTLQQLDLSYNDQVTDAGYTALTQSLHSNKTLKGLKLVRYGDAITPKGYKEVMQLFQKNHTIEELLLQPAPQDDFSNLEFYLFLNQHRYLVENENITRRELVEQLSSHRNDLTFLFLFLKAKPSLCDEDG